VPPEHPIWFTFKRSDQVQLSGCVCSSDERVCVVTPN
jgi:hypothetical protein